MPFLLVPVLAGMAVVQLALPTRIELPPGGAVARAGMVAPPEAPPVVIVPKLLASRDPFAPPARRSGADGGDPLEGAVIAGVIQRGSLRLGVIQQASGAVRYVGIGGEIAGWRLVALDQGEARLTRGPGQNLRVTYGLHATLPQAAAQRMPLSPQTSEGGQ